MPVLLIAQKHSTRKKNWDRVLRGLSPFIKVAVWKQFRLPLPLKRFLVGLHWQNVSVVRMIVSDNYDQTCHFLRLNSHSSPFATFTPFSPTLSLSSSSKKFPPLNWHRSTFNYNSNLQDWQNSLSLHCRQTGTLFTDTCLAKLSGQSVSVIVILMGIQHKKQAITPIFWAPYLLRPLTWVRFGSTCIAPIWCSRP